jgi:hypothetical protein
MTAIFERHAGDFRQGLRWEWQLLDLIGKNPHECFDRARRLCNRQQHENIQSHANKIRK